MNEHNAFASQDTAYICIHNDLTNRIDKIFLKDNPAVSLNCPERYISEANANDIMKQLSQMQFPFELYHMDGTETFQSDKVIFHNIDKETDWEEKITKRDTAIPAIFMLEAYKKSYGFSKENMENFELECKNSKYVDWLEIAVSYLMRIQEEGKYLNIIVFLLVDMNGVLFHNHQKGIDYNYGFRLQGSKYRYRVPGFDFVPNIKKINQSKWRKKQSIEYLIACLEVYHQFKENKEIFDKDLFSFSTGCVLSDLDNIRSELYEENSLRCTGWDRLSYCSDSLKKLRLGFRAVMDRTEFSSVATAILTKHKKAVIKVCKEKSFEELECFRFPHFWQYVDIEIIQAIYHNAPVEQKKEIQRQIEKLDESFKIANQEKINAVLAFGSGTP